MHVGGIDFQGRQTKQHERQTNEEIAEVGVLLGVDKRYSQYDSGIHNQAEVERSAAEHHDPCREGRTDVGTHDDRDSLRQRENTRRDETDGHDRCSRGRLNRRSNERTGEHARETVGSHRAKHVGQLATCHLLQAFTHHLHSVHQHRYGTDECNNLE